MDRMKYMTNLSLNLSRGQSLSTRSFEVLIGLITRNLLFFFLA